MDEIVRLVRELGSNVVKENVKKVLLMNVNLVLTEKLNKISSISLDGASEKSVKVVKTNECFMRRSS